VSSNPEPTAEATQLCKSGQEVAVCDQTIEQSLVFVTFSTDHTHAVRYDDDDIDEERDDVAAQSPSGRNTSPSSRREEYDTDGGDDSVYDHGGDDRP